MLARSVRREKSNNKLSPPPLRKNMNLLFFTPSILDTNYIIHPKCISPPPPSSPWPRASSPPSPSPPPTAVSVPSRQDRESAPAPLASAARNSASADSAPTFVRPLTHLPFSPHLGEKREDQRRKRLTSALSRWWQQYLSHASSHAWYGWRRPPSASTHG